MTRDFHWLVAFGRVKQGGSLHQAQSAMSALGARIATDFPASNKGWGVVVERYADTLIGPDMRRALLVLMVATGLVLLIGCANLANLALTRGLSREREVVVRASLGARRGLLIRQFLTEHVLLSVSGGALGLAVLASLAASRTDSLTASGSGELEALAGGYHAAFLVGALFAGAAAAIGVLLLRPAAASAMHGEAVDEDAVAEAA